MCGRYAASRSAAELGELFGLPVDPAEPVPRSWNVCPTDRVPVVLADRIGVARWGLAGPDGRRHINARAETVATRPAFRAAFGRGRVLLPADGWYEWAGGQPYFLRVPGRPVIALAGLAAEDPEGAGRAVAVVTTRASADLERLHGRMPVVLPPEGWADWLGPEVPPERLAALLGPSPAGAVRADPVGPAVGSARADGPGLTRPVDTLF